MPESISKEQDKGVDLEKPKCCHKCKRCVFGALNYYCHWCGERLMILPETVKNIGVKDELEKDHDKNPEGEHRKYSRTLKFLHCPMCGDDLSEFSEQEDEEGED